MTEVLARLLGALADRYAIQCEISSGGMATVYLARYSRSEQTPKEDIPISILQYFNPTVFPRQVLLLKERSIV